MTAEFVVGPIKTDFEEQYLQYSVPKLGADMLLVITVALAGAVIFLIGYAVYLKLTLLTGKGRFATSVVSAILLAVPTTIFAVGQLNFFDSVFSIVSTISGNPPLSDGWAVASKALDYFLIIVLCLLSIRALYRFGQSTVEAWDAPPTSLDAELVASGAQNELFQVAREYVTMRTSGKSDLIIDERSFELTLELSDTPPNPTWDAFARDLIMEAINEISVPEDSWSTELNCWFGTLAPLSDPSKTSTIAILPVPRPLTADEAISALNGQHSKCSHIYVCVDSDASDDKVEDKDGITIRSMHKGSLLILGVNLRSYCDDLIRRFERDTILGTALKLSDIFTEPTLSTKDGSPSVQFSELIDTWSNSEDRQQLSLIGEFGQGKSSAILHYCANWAKEYLENPKIERKIPLLIPLRGRDPSTLTRSNLLAAWGTQYRLSGRALLNLVVAGRAILFFEGFDEVNNAGLRSQRLAQFDALWRFAFPRAKIAFTGRPNFFLDDTELRRLLRIDEIVAASGQPFATLYAFRFFDQQKVAEALRPFPIETQTGVIEHYQNDARFRDVASRPSMLPLIAITWNDIKESLSGSSKVTSAKVIENYVEFEYRRKEREVEDEQLQHGLTKRQNYLSIPRNTKNFYMMSIARDIQRSGKTNTIERDDMERGLKAAHQIAESYVVRIGVEDEEIQYFNDYRSRSKEIGEKKALEALASDIRTTGVLVRDTVSGPNSYYFPHKQFYEYFIALYCYYSVQQKLLGESKGAYWNFFSMSNPCAALSREPEAKKFFAEMADQNWFDHVFTVNSVTIAKIYAIAAASAITWIEINERVISAGKFMDAIGSFRLPRFPEYVVTLFVPSTILTATVMLLAHFPVAVAASIGLVTLVTALGAWVSVNGNSLFGLLQWYELISARFPADASTRAKRVLGPVAYKATRTLDDYIFERRLAAKRRNLDR